MSGHTARVRAGNDRANLYTEITDKIIAELEAGRIPWVQPWGTAAIKAPLSMPRNASTQRGYSGRKVAMMRVPGVGHRFVAKDSADAAVSWIVERCAGRPAPTDS